MRGIAVAISSAALAIGLATPSLLLAQDAPPDEPAAASQPSAPGDVPAGEPEGPAPPSGEEATEEPPAYDAPAPETYSTSAAAAGSVSVSIQDFLFSPGTVTVGVGGTVTWSNSGAEDHTATGSGFDTGTLSPGASASHTFAAAGTFSYICNIHPDMTGTVQVLADSGTDPGGTPGGDGTTPTDDPTATSSTDPTAAPGSEAAAALDPNAAGSNGLPATGEPEGVLVLLGLGLIGCGLLALSTARLREREVLHLTDRF
jgi:plastocyanin